MEFEFIGADMRTSLIRAAGEQFRRMSPHEQALATVEFKRTTEQAIAITSPPGREQENCDCERELMKKA